jgi:hypothetical protein
MMKLRKAGLIIMLLPLAFYIIFAITHGLNEYYDLSTNLIAGLSFGVPCLLFTAAAWLWPRRGGVAAVVLSLLLLALATSSSVTSVDWHHRDFSFLMDIFVWAFPYAVLLVGSILAFVSAKKANSPDLLPRISTGNARVDKLRKAGLLIMFLFGVLTVLLFIIGIGISGDMVLVGNLWTGLQLGLVVATPPLLLAVVAWRWPLWGGGIAAGVSIALITLSIIRIVTDIFFPLWFFSVPLVGLSFIFLLIGSILVLASVRKDRKLSL